MKKSQTGVIAAGASFISLFVGIGIGLNNAPTEAPEEVPTEVETVYVESEPEVVVRTKVTDLPESCTELVEKADGLLDQEGEISRLVGEVNFAASDIHKYAQDGSIEKMQAEIQVMIDATDELDDVLLDHATSQTSFKTALEVCEQMIAVQSQE